MINIAITHKDRNNYLRITLATLKEACRDHDDVRIYLYDDNSMTPLPRIVSEMDNLEVIQMFGLYKAAPGDESTPRYKFVVTDMFDRTDGDYIFIADSDAAFHPQAIQAIKTMIDDLPRLGFGGIFNTINYGDGISFCGGKYVHKVTVGLFCTLIRREVWNKYGPGILKAFDMNLSCGVEQDADWDVRVTFQSYVEHIGHEGMHNRGDETAVNYIDRSKRFLND